MTRKPSSSCSAALRAAALAVIALVACGGGPGRGAASAERGSRGVNLRACGSPAGDLGRRMQTFLEATVALEAELASNDAALRATCAVMARRLGLPGESARGPRARTTPVCMAVAGALRAQLAAGPESDPDTGQGDQPAAAAAPAVAAPAASASAPAIASRPLVVRAAPATCTVPRDIAAQVAACAQGSRAAQAAPVCEVTAALAASAAAVCTAPAIDIALGPGADATRLAATLRTLREDLPIVLRLRARLAGPLQAAMLTWGRVATDLVAAGPAALRPLGGQASCVFAQLEAAAARLAAMQASLAAQLAAAAALETAARLQDG